MLHPVIGCEASHCKYGIIAATIHLDLAVVVVVPNWLPRFPALSFISFAHISTKRFTSSLSIVTLW